MARIRNSPASSGITRRHMYQCWGKPWRSTSAGASSGPAWATCARTPVESSWKRCATPGSSITGRGDHLVHSLALQAPLRDQRHAGVLALELLVVADRAHRGAHAVHAHLERVLGDQRGDGA